MPKEISNLELEEIVSVVRGFPRGVDIQQIKDGLSFELQVRTLQRRMTLLEKEGLIASQGSGKGKRYIPVVLESVSNNFVQNTSKWDADSEQRWETKLSSPTKKYTVTKQQSVTEILQPATDLVLSAAAKEIRAIIKSPLSARIPVGYDPTFLTNYQPNQTYYLPEETRRKLSEMGQVGITDLPAGTYLRQIMDRLLIDLSWNSSRLEGNTYSLLETQRLLELGETADGKATQEAQMILNHKATIEMLADQAEEIGFNRYTICSLHALLSDNLMSDPAACGRLRDRAVGISGTVFHPLEVPQRIEEYFNLILSKAEAIEDPFEASFFVMVQMPYLQAFEDVNKRVSRLAANIPLIRKNLCPLSFIDIETDDYLSALIGVYELRRIDYMRDVFVWSYTRSSQRYAAIRQSLGEPDPFRMKYRNQIGITVREIVQRKLTKKKIENWILKTAEVEVPDLDQKQFIRTIEIELRCLHEGNIARFRLRPSEFSAWKSETA